MAAPNRDKTKHPRWPAVQPTDWRSENTRHDVYVCSKKELLEEAAYLRERTAIDTLVGLAHPDVPHAVLPSLPYEFTESVAVELGPHLFAGGKNFRRTGSVRQSDVLFEKGKVTKKVEVKSYRRPRLGELWRSGP
jgi:hypothetical protein